MTTPACSPESPWRCPPGIRERILRETQIDEGLRLRESDVWFDEWKRTRPPQPSQSPAISQREELVKKVDTYFRPPDLKLETRELSVNLSNYVATPPPVVEQSWRIVELLPRQKNPLDEVFRRKFVDDVIIGDKIRVIDPASDRIRKFVDNVIKKNPLDEVFRRKFVDDVITPPPGVEVSWRPGVSPPRQKNPEEALGEAVKRLEEQRRREAGLFERLDQLKSTWSAVPRLIELPEPPLAIPPWRWVPIRPFPIIQLIKPLESETHRKVPA